MKLSELRELDNAQLQQRLIEIDQELFNLRFQQETGRLTNSARIGQLRKEIAQVKTMLRERQLAREVGR
ncbi:MAG: LSU ribosomal protein L29p (L35e) [uncultured Chloroflexia bacterium]|uniref:Large ribosomal subunit protein uL29 n=1 Tax=uncultured Chloroflexia bacterium TaxID=1672391 RepID=A0A6J4NF89_9CHLR|nr:MAG: LSU ribosomal protein L29p (L35e) [uncultured Chloroflexia bacterium]